MSKKKQEPKEYWFSLRATYEGATASVLAYSLEEAREKANRGDFLSSIETETAELVDWELGRNIAIEQ